MYHANDDLPFSLNYSGISLIDSMGDVQFDGTHYNGKGRNLGMHPEFAAYVAFSSTGEVTVSKYLQKQN